MLYFSPFILANCACQARISEYTPADKDTENKGLNFPGVELMKVTRQNGKKILALISELGILSSILSTLSVPLVSREVMCAVSSEAPLLSGLQKAVLSVQGVIAVFSSERGKAKTIFQLLEAWHHGKSHYQLVGGTERQETTKGLRKLRVPSR